MINQIIFVTGNEGKVKSIKEHLVGFDVEIIQKKLPLIEPQESSIEAVAISKATQAFNILKQPVIVEDSAFFIDALPGFPGLYSKFILKTIGAEGILKLMEGVLNRSCRFTSVLAYIDSSGVPRTFIDEGDAGTLTNEIDQTPCEEAWSDLWRIFTPKDETKPLTALSGEERKRVWDEWKTHSTFMKFALWLKEHSVKAAFEPSPETDETGRLLSNAFEFPIPREKIALRPRPHGQHKLLVYDRVSREITHHQFEDLGNLLPKGSVIVVNNSRVVKAALRKPVDDGTYLHVMYPNHESLNEVYTLCPWKPPVGEKVFVNGGYYEVKGAPIPNRDVRVGVLVPDDKNIKNLPEFLDRFGSLPIPIYINSERPPDSADNRDYQNCYAKVPGSIECPTAGLHFYPELMDSLKKQGLEFVEITLHIGYGTWKSLKAKYIDEHEMDPEEMVVTPEAFNRLIEVKKENRPLLAVGTSGVRTLETIAPEVLRGEKISAPITKETSLYIHPPYDFKLADMLLTNFAYPRTPIMVLPATFIGLGELKRIYQEALAHDYLFYTYGDSILIK